MIRPGFDKSSTTSQHQRPGKERLVEYEGKLREETGIKNLRIVLTSERDTSSKSRSLILTKSRKNYPETNLDELRTHMTSALGMKR